LIYFRYTPIGELAALASHHSAALLNPFATAAAAAAAAAHHSQQQSSAGGPSTGHHHHDPAAAAAVRAIAAAASVSGHMPSAYFEASSSGAAAASVLQSARLGASLSSAASFLPGAGGGLSATASAKGATTGASGGVLLSAPLDQHAQRLAAASGLSSGWCLFVYNLAPETEESVIWKLFGPFGAIQQVNLVKDSQTNKCKGFAFVTMSDYNQALMAIQSLNGYTLANRVLQVSFKTNKVRKTTSQ
jgi:hypothetical protein